MNNTHNRKKTRRQLAEEVKANAIAYSVQDMMDSISYTFEEQIKNFEKKVLQIMREDYRKWLPPGGGKRGISKSKK